MDYKGWKLKAYRKKPFPPYPHYMCEAWRYYNNTWFMFNTEGHSIKQAINCAKDKIDDREFNLLKDPDIKLEKCEFII